MIADFIEEYAKLIVLYPEDIEVKVDSFNGMDEITLYANSVDIGKLIGKEGKMITSIKTLISGCKAKDGKSYRINVETR